MVIWHSHSGIIVNSLATALPFYRDVLGLRVVWEVERVPDPRAPRTGHYLDGVHIRLAWLRRGDVQIELVDYVNKKDVVQDRGALDPHAGHQAFFVDDIQKHHDRLKVRGVRFAGPPAFHGPGVATVFGKDPDGNWVQLSLPPQGPKIEPSLDEGGFGHGAAGLIVDRMEDALPFYRDLLGMEVVRTVERSADTPAKGAAPKGRPLKEVWLKRGGFRIKLVDFRDKTEKAPGVGAMDVHSTHLAFFCDDLPAEHQRLASHGIWFRDPAYGADGKPMHFAYGKDPDGNWFELNAAGSHGAGALPRPA